MSLQFSWDEYTGSCDCGHRYGTNCAHALSDALIDGGFSAIDGGNGADMRMRKGFCVCRSGRPIRAAELRSWLGKQWSRHTKPHNGVNIVYQASPGGQGHVLLKNYKEGKLTGFRFMGTGDYPSWPTQEYYY